MRPRSRARRVLKWTGLAFSLLLLGLWLFSFKGTVFYGVDGFVGHAARIGVVEGMAGVCATDRVVLDGWRFTWDLHAPIAKVRWLPKYLWTPQHKDVFVPLWMPLVLVIFPTFIFWWRERRCPKGHCQTCGYDLTGNVSGICPECGEKIVGQVEDLPGPPSCD